MIRAPSHVISTKSVNIIKSKVDGFYDNGDALFREISGFDYGIDGMIELFENTCPTGEIALVQIKGTENKIMPLKTFEGVSCSITTSNIQYAFQNNLPVILLYVSIKDSIIYYECLNNVSNSISDEKMNQDKITIRIPNENMIQDDMEPIFRIIKSFYD